MSFATSGPASIVGSSFVKAVQLAKEDLKSTTHQYRARDHIRRCSTKSRLSVPSIALMRWSVAVNPLTIIMKLLNR